MGTQGKQEKHKLREIVDSWKENLTSSEYELIRKGLYIGLPVLLVLIIAASASSFFIANHEAFRTLALSLAALIGLPLLIWRGVSLDRSSKAAEKQAENASKSHVADTYTRAIEQLGAMPRKFFSNDMRVNGKPPEDPLTFLVVVPEFDLTQAEAIALINVNELAALPPPLQRILIGQKVGVANMIVGDADGSGQEMAKQLRASRETHWQRMGEIVSLHKLARAHQDARDEYQKADPDKQEEESY